MDGGGRLLRSVNALATDFAPPAFAPPRLAGAGYPAAVWPARRAGGLGSPRSGARTSKSATRRRARRSLAARLLIVVQHHTRLVGISLGLALFLLVWAYGAVCGGQYAAFVETNGSIADLLARGFGFGIDVVTLSGLNELSENQILATAGVSPKSSLLLLDAADVRRRLKALPMIQDASVTKLYPDRLLVSLTERQPFALWQKDGEVSILSQDGSVIDERRDERHDDLPFVTGENANLHVADYVKVLAAAGDLKAKIRAGALVAERRWDLVMSSGVTVKLPEIDPAGALASLAQLERSSHILEKDIVLLDLRVPGRVIARLTEEAAAARSQTFARKTGKRGGPT